MALMRNAGTLFVSWGAQIASSCLPRSSTFLRLRSSRICTIRRYHSQQTCAAQVWATGPANSILFHMLARSVSKQPSILSGHIYQSSFLIESWRLQTSQRVALTDDPVIVKTKQLMAGSNDVISLAQGPSSHFACLM